MGNYHTQQSPVNQFHQQSPQPTIQPVTEPVMQGFGPGARAPLNQRSATTRFRRATKPFGCGPPTSFPATTSLTSPIVCLNSSSGPKRICFDANARLQEEKAGKQGGAMPLTEDLPGSLQRFDGRHLLPGQELDRRPTAGGDVRKLTLKTKPLDGRTGVPTSHHREFHG